MNTTQSEDYIVVDTEEGWCVVDASEGFPLIELESNNEHMS